MLLALTGVIKVYNLLYDESSVIENTNCLVLVIFFSHDVDKEIWAIEERGGENNPMPAGIQIKRQILLASP